MILKKTTPPENEATQQHMSILEMSVELSCVVSFTSIVVRLLLLNAGSHGVELPVDVLACSDPAEDLTSLLAAALLEEPAGALREEEEADELHHGRDAGQAQHVPAGGEIQRAETQIWVFLSSFLAFHPHKINF